jgi:DNA polymerase-3 subunit gamma/tau
MSICPAKMTDFDSGNPHSPSNDPTNYTVVARRYRPRSFQELVGQEHISQALAKAIATGRVGHAYLFTGARGVGKTSSARIFAKALNAPGGPTAEPVAESDISHAIDVGEDVDVIEIDAASNRGIDEIRRLRANATIRPSRSRYKIYIIDEVHMLTKEAFNALLKTLEEPPEHVKFIFCTTDPEKVPITVVSRCQRFDFAPVRSEAIAQRLAEICRAEGFEAEDDALALLARRAAGSMRDSQSLLEQVMSFSSGRITVVQIHELLGTADESHLSELAQALVHRDAQTALRLVNQAIAGGTDAGQYAEQLLGYLRDLMAVAVGCGADLLKYSNPSNLQQLQQVAQQWGLQSILAAVQILDESLVRMRMSVHSQALFELALVQIAQLQDLAGIAQLLESLKQGGPIQVPPLREATRVPPQSQVAASPSGSTSHSAAVRSTAVEPGSSVAPEKKNIEVLVERSPTVAHVSSPPVSAAGSGAVQASHPTPAGSPGTPNSTAALETWKRAAHTTEGMLADFAAGAIAVECPSDSQWIIWFPAGSQKSVEYCEAPARRAELQAAVESAAGRSIQFQYRVQSGPVQRTRSEPAVSATVVRSQRIRQLTEHPYVSKLCEALQGEVVRVDPPEVEQRPHKSPSDLADPAMTPTE